MLDKQNYSQKIRHYSPFDSSEKKKRMVKTFFFPDAPDFSVVNFKDIVRKLLEPEFTGGTSCAVTAMSFNINFEKYKFC